MGKTCWVCERQNYRDRQRIGRGRNSAERSGKAVSTVKYSYEVGPVVKDAARSKREGGEETLTGGEPSELQQPLDGGHQFVREAWLRNHIIEAVQEHLAAFVGHRVRRERDNRDAAK
jgi:hypothetical protein